MPCSAYIEKTGECSNGYSPDCMICYGSDLAAERSSIKPPCQRENDLNYPLTGHPVKEAQAKADIELDECHPEDLQAYH